MCKNKNSKEILEKYFFSKYDDRTPFEKIIGYCDSCPYSKHRYCLFKYPKTVRLNTMYANERDNYFTGCDEILEYICKANSEAWEEYYNSRF